MPAPVEDDTESDDNISYLIEDSETMSESRVESESLEESISEEDEHSPQPVSPAPQPQPLEEPPVPSPLEEPPAPQLPSVSGADLQALIGRLQIDATQSYEGNWLKLEEALKSIILV